MKIKNAVITDRYALYNGDCCEVLTEIPNDSVGFSIFSPPFSELYKYTDEDADMSNVSNPDDFFEHFSYLVKELFRVMSPGRIVAVHCMVLPTFLSKGEEIGVWDFPGRIIKCFEEVGFIYHCPPITIWKDPLLAAVRTKAIGLAHKQIVKDSSMCRTGIPDQVLAFRKPGANAKPVEHPLGLTEYAGSREVPRKFDKFLGWDGPQNVNKRSHWIWQQYASPVWFDVRQTRVLPHKEGRDSEDEKHICPLQLDVIERCLTLWATEDDVVLTPFMGVGSEVYVSVKLGCKAIGVELKQSYFDQAVMNLKSLSKRIKEAKGFGL
jgi:DNA modification methylase